MPSASAPAVSLAVAPAPARPGWWEALASVDHKRIGLRYLVTAMLLLLIGGVEALLLRVQLAQSGQHFLRPEIYNQLFTMHGVTMILWYAAPILSGFGNYLVPLMLGSADMAMPRLNAFSYWTFLLSGVVIQASLVLGVAPDAGWFAYAPVTLPPYSPGPNLDFYALALIFLTVSTTAGAINFIVTILRFRSPGMSLGRMPLLMYSTLTTSVLTVLALPALTAACVFLYLDRRFGTHFFDASHGGTPLLWQHLFWFFGHPWVYIIFLPATGMVSMMVPVYARHAIVGYRWVAAATVMTGVVGMAVWVHHMFATGMSQAAMSVFSGASIVISLFSTVQIFAWLATLWHGKPVMTVALHYVLGFIALFVIGGLTGVATAFIPLDWQLTDSYFVVAHIHYVILGANLFPVFAAFYHWLPKMTGRLMNEKAGRWSFWLMFVGFNLGFFPMHIVGVLGMPRRIYSYPAGLGWNDWNLMISAGAFLFAAGVLVSLVNFLVSSRNGAAAGPDPWQGDTLEWLLASPPPEHGHEHVVTVQSPHPLWDGTDAPSAQTGPAIPPHTALVTHWKTGAPLALAHMPHPTIAPLLLALLLTGLVAALIAVSLEAAAVMAFASLCATAYWLWPHKPQAAP